MKELNRMKSGLIMVWALIHVLSVAAADRIVKVNPAERLQTIDHFTASDAWSGALVGRYWPEVERQQIATWLFSQEMDNLGCPKGIGLSLWRVNTGAGTWEQPDCDIQPIRRRAESFMTTDAAHDLSRVGQFDQLPVRFTVAPRSLVTVTLSCGEQNPIRSQLFNTFCSKNSPTIDL